MKHRGQRVWSPLFKVLRGQLTGNSLRLQDYSPRGMFPAKNLTEQTNHKRLASSFGNLNCLTDIRSLIHPLSLPLHYNPLHPIPLTLSLRNALEAARSDQNPVPLAIDGPDLCFYFMKSGRKFWPRTHIASPAGGRLLANTLSNTQFLLQFKKY